MGCSLKVISGANRLVATGVAKQVGLEDPEVITGEDLHQISDAALPGRVGEADVFAEVEPNQKERIILALKKRGDVVGYLGDGINDAPALHAADVSLSVQGAADVAKEAAYQTASRNYLEHDRRLLYRASSAARGGQQSLLRPLLAVSGAPIRHLSRFSKRFLSEAGE